MKQIEWIESFYNVMDAGVFIQTVNNVLKKKIEMNPLTFMKRLILGKGYQPITPPQLTENLNNTTKVLVVDLRDKREFEIGHIDGAICHPFDEFIGDIVMNNGYVAYRHKPITLVCHCGLKSRVAASVLADEGFTHIFSLKRGMRRWYRWEKLLKICNQIKFKTFYKGIFQYCLT